MSVKFECNRVDIRQFNGLFTTVPNVIAVTYQYNAPNMNYILLSKSSVNRATVQMEIIIFKRPCSFYPQLIFQLKEFI
jgi:hypothetical protein